MYAFGLLCSKVVNQFLNSIESKVEPAPAKTTPPAGTLFSGVLWPEEEQPEMRLQSTPAITANSTLTASECLTRVRMFCLHQPTGTSNPTSGSRTLGTCSPFPSTKVSRKRPLGSQSRFLGD